MSFTVFVGYKPQQKWKKYESQSRRDACNLFRESCTLNAKSQLSAARLTKVPNGKARLFATTPS